MIINKSEPIDLKGRVFINTKNNSNLTYMIAEHGQGKSSETVRQAAVRQGVILSPTNQPYKNYGVMHGDDMKERLGVRYITLYDLFQGNQYELPEGPDGYVHICVDEGRLILEELLSQTLDMSVKIDFMTLDTGESYDD